MAENIIKSYHLNRKFRKYRAIAIIFITISIIIALFTTTIEDSSLRNILYVLVLLLYPIGAVIIYYSFKRSCRQIG